MKKSRLFGLLSVPSNCWNFCLPNMTIHCGLRDETSNGLREMKLSLLFSLSFSLLFSPLSSFPSRTPSDLQADSMEILPGTASVLCCPLIFSFATGISTGIFLVLHNQLGVHYSLYFSFASAFWGASSTCVGTAPGLKAGRTQRFLSPLSLLPSSSHHCHGCFSASSQYLTVIPPPPYC